jgi:hypothetical protein
MPLINGVCVPPVCVKLSYDKTKMVLTYFDTAKGKAVPQPALWTAADEMTALDGLFPTTAVECDGCTCWHPFPPGPWTPMAGLQANHPTVLNYKVVLQVTGVKVRAKTGICLPPGTQVKGANGQWRPVGGEGGGEKSGGKKPKKMR